MLFNEAELQQKLQKTLDHFQSELKKIRTGRATMDMFENIEVEAYGAQSKLTAVSNVVIEDAISVRINIWDPSIGENVEKALVDANIGATVVREKDHIRVRFSPITEETRKESVKELKGLLEEHKVSMRQTRQEFMQKVQGLEGVSKDDQKRDEETIQKHIDNYIAKLDDVATKKEEDLMQV